jgi:hypothetical protein
MPLNKENAHIRSEDMGVPYYLKAFLNCLYFTSSGFTRMDPAPKYDVSLSTMRFATISTFFIILCLVENFL